MNRLAIAAVLCLSSAGVVIAEQPAQSARARALAMVERLGGTATAVRFDEM